MAIRMVVDFLNQKQWKPCQWNYILKIIKEKQTVKLEFYIQWKQNLKNYIKQWMGYQWNQGRNKILPSKKQK